MFFFYFCSSKCIRQMLLHYNKCYISLIPHRLHTLYIYIYILIHIGLYQGVSDKKIWSGRLTETRLLVFLAWVESLIIVTMIIKTIIYLTVAYARNYLQLFYSHGFSLTKAERKMYLLIYLLATFSIFSILSTTTKGTVNVKFVA